MRCIRRLRGEEGLGVEQERVRREGGDMVYCDALTITVGSCPFVKLPGRLPALVELNARLTGTISLLLAKTDAVHPPSIFHVQDAAQEWIVTFLQHPTPQVNEMHCPTRHILRQLIVRWNPFQTLNP